MYLTVPGARMRTPSSSPPRSKHLGEAVVVVGGTDQSAAAAVGLRLASARRGPSRQSARPACRRVCAVQRGESGCVRLVDEPRRLVHAEWLEQAGAHQLVEPLAGDDLQHAPEHVEADRVVPFGAGLEQQW